MKVGIITDSHDHHANVLQAADIFRQRQVQHILHCGDIVSPFTAKALLADGLPPVTAVFGNNDGEKLMLRSVFQQAGASIHEGWHTFTLGDRQMIMTHIPFTLKQVVASQDYDVVLYGHTHKQDIRREGRTLVMNPGESTDWITGQAHVAILDLASLDYEVVRLA